MRTWSWQDHSSIDLGDSSETTTTKIRPNQKQILLVILKWVLTATIFGVITFFTLFGIDFNAHVTLKSSSIQYNLGELSSTCFQQHSIPAAAEESVRYGIIPSVPLIEDDVCYNFASLMQPTNSNATSVIYHTFWSSKPKMTELELATVRSFIATQQSTSVLYLWISSKEDQSILEQQLQLNSRIQIQLITDDIVKNTALTASWQQLQQNNKKKDLLIRLLSLYKYGGVWFDLNSNIFIRDMSPLLSQEWISSSHCLTNEMDGSFLRFFKQSPFLCEMIYELDSQSTATAAKDLYSRIYYRLLHYKISTWSILPWCYTDPSQCKKSNSLPNVFSNTWFSQVKLEKVFAFHWHKSFFSSNSASEGSIFSYLVDQHKQIVGW